jgi:hypothetical protein
LRQAEDRRGANPSLPETGRPGAAAREARPAVAPSRQAEAQEVPVVHPEAALAVAPWRPVAANPEVRRVAGPSRQVEAPEAYLAAALRWPDLQVAPFGIPEADRQARVRKVLTRSEAEQRRAVQAAGPGIPDVHPAAAQ